MLMSRFLKPSRERQFKIMKEILISGYYGFHNSGDDALLSCIINDIERIYGDRRKIVVLSASPEETTRLYGVRAIDRMNIFSVISHMGSSELLISGGGTLIQDGTSTQSLLYYLGVIAMAKFFGLKVMLYANGIGPLIRKSNKRITRKVLNKADVITLRDKRSLETLSEIGVSGNIHVTADPVFGLYDINPGKGMEILKHYRVPEDCEYMAISVRNDKNITDERLMDIAAAADECAEKYNIFPVIIPMQRVRDESISQKLKKYIRHESVVIPPDIEVYELLSVISNMKFCIGMRLHTLIYAAVASVPVIGIVYDPKVSGFMEYSNQDLYLDTGELTKEKLTDMIDSILINYRERKAMLTRTAAEMRKNSEKNAQLLRQLMEA